jgi:YjbR
MDDRLRRLGRASSLALDAAEYAEVAAPVLARLRALCLALPETTENPGWAGVQWRIRRRRFAHVLAIDFPEGPETVLTFRSAGEELTALRRSGPPFFATSWGTDQVGMVLDAATDWDDVAELVSESYCLLAPRKLVRLLDRPAPRDDAP